MSSPASLRLMDAAATMRVVESAVSEPLSLARIPGRQRYEAIKAPACPRDDIFSPSSAAAQYRQLNLYVLSAVSIVNADM
jgi:hypothetical protein